MLHIALVLWAGFGYDGISITIAREWLFGIPDPNSLYGDSLASSLRLCVYMTQAQKRGHVTQDGKDGMTYKQFLKQERQDRTVTRAARSPIPIPHGMPSPSARTLE